MNIQDTSDPRAILEEFEVESIDDLRAPFNHAEYKLAIRLLAKHLKVTPEKVHNELIQEIWKRTNQETEEMTE